MLKSLFIFVAVIYLVFTSSPAFAANEFSTSYVLNYTIDELGVTEVNEQITLKNLTEKFFPSSFSLVLPGQNVFDVEASDTQGDLQVENSKEGANTKLTVKFSNQQIIGLGKEYIWKLKFKDSSIASKIGKVLSVNIPKINQQNQIENLKLTVSVPVMFGDPDFINRKPRETSESGGKINLVFGKDELIQSGISAIFGISQSFKFSSSYQAKNSSIFPKYLKFVLPRDTNYQRSYVEQIEPVPENTEVDKYGNSLVIYRLNPGQNLQVKAAGFINTYLAAQEKELVTTKDLELFTNESKYWEKNNPLIKTKLFEIIKNDQNTERLDQVKAIDQYVSNFLRFDLERLSSKDFTRFGSITALNNPEKSMSAEFVDLEIALLRGLGIPARQIIGTSFNNTSSKPYSYYNTSLHSWVEFYQPNFGWLPLDPTWENTTSGADFFTYNDLSHIVLMEVGKEDDYILPSKFEAQIYEEKIEEKRAARVSIQIDKQILSGFPAIAIIKIKNLGNMSFPSNTLQIDTSKILLKTKDSDPAITKIITTPSIPAFGSLEYKFSLKTGAIWHSYQDIFQVRFAGLEEVRVINVVPILSYKIFAVEIFGGLTMILLFYILVLIVHHKQTRKTS